MKFNLILIFFIISVTNAFKILVLFPFIAKSHWLMFEYLIEEMLRHGHDVTAITSFKPHRGLLLNGHENYTEILIEPAFDVNTLVSFNTFYEKRDHSHVKSLLNIYNIGLATARHGLESKNVRELIKNQDENFDIIVAEQFMQESWLMFAYKYKAPVVALNTFGYSDAYDRIYGYYTPWSIVPHHLLPYTDDMTFIERYHNAAICIIDWILRSFYHYPTQQMLIDQYFAPYLTTQNNTNDLPNVYELEQKVALIMINSHVALDHPRPSMPNIINVGGIHLRPSNHLPRDLDSFITGAKHGVIYFSFGSNIKGSDMPKKLQESFINVFRELPQRILWKWEGDTPKNIPENILIWNWFPQHDILAHPNIVLFITHGGLFSLQESLYNGIPLFIIPFFNDQFKNAQRSTREGYALTHNIHELTEQKIKSTITELILNPKYQKRAREVSEIFKDNLMAPMDTAIYWIEYVAKHKKAREFLISKAIKLHVWEYYMLDVIFVTFFGCITFIYTLVYVIRKIKDLMKILNRRRNKIKTS